jgi:hypothetical protein
MGLQKLCACNPACEVLISQRIEQFDTVHEAFLTLVERLSNVHTSALWLNPFRGIPKGPRFSRFDMIYLDEAGKVMKCTQGYTEAEKFAEFSSARIEETATSVLILPLHTLQNMRIHAGDQIKICGVGKVLVGADVETETGLGASGADQCVKQIMTAPPGNNKSEAKCACVDCQTCHLRSSQRREAQSQTAFPAMDISARGTG